MEYSLTELGESLLGEKSFS
nr:hypothetical protein [Bacillus timonensis]